jgi:hypothetical protein
MWRAAPLHVDGDEEQRRLAQGRSARATSHVLVSRTCQPYSRRAARSPLAGLVARELADDGVVE